MFKPTIVATAPKPIVPKPTVGKVFSVGPKFCASGTAGGVTRFLGTFESEGAANAALNKFSGNVQLSTPMCYY